MKNIYKLVSHPFALKLNLDIILQPHIKSVYTNLFIWQIVMFT
jgi:hypothetical protein